MKEIFKNFSLNMGRLILNADSMNKHYKCNYYILILKILRFKAAYLI